MFTCFIDTGGHLTMAVTSHFLATNYLPYLNRGSDAKEFGVDACPVVNLHGLFRHR